MEQSLWEIIVNAVDKSGGVEKGILFLLVGLSILSWALIFRKALMIRRVRRANQQFLEIFARAEHTGQVLTEGAGLKSATMFAVFKHGMETFSLVRQSGRAGAVGKAANGEGNLPLKTAAGLAEKVELSMRHASKVEFSRMFWGMDTLASIGSSTPFIGLLGTVWGIMGTFQALSGAKSASLQVVAPGIASALIATAAGLAVAIPAVVAYNWAMARMDEIQENVSSFIEQAILFLHAGGGLNVDAAADKSKKEV